MAITSRKKASKSARLIRTQYGALPYRFTKGGSLELLLVTSRQSKRWIIPKGWPIKGLKPAPSAAREAYEEAGIQGLVGKAIGTYIYGKQADDDGKTVLCEVTVFPLLVRRQWKTWPEGDERERRWLAPAKALPLIEEDDLRKLISAFIKRASVRAARA
jgi:8-oxo-dGTP pyrophosphatase MutT (NUDIX family)